VLRAARAAGVQRLVHVSTEAVLVGGSPIRRAREDHPRPARPIGLYPATKAQAELLAIGANGPELAVVVVRPRLVWGRGDTSLLPQIADAVRRGSFRWIGGGRFLTSTCHVANLCAGMIAAAERGRGGEVYFLTDGEPVEMREFLGALLQAEGVDPGAKSVPRWVAAATAGMAEALWRGFRLRGKPPITRTAVKLVGEEVTVDDSKARRELGYTGVVTRDEGLRQMTAAA